MFVDWMGVKVVLHLIKNVLVKKRKKEFEKVF